MAYHESNLQKIVVQLYEIGAVKFGDFKMKIGVNSPVYFDLRVIVSYPKLLAEVSELLAEFGKEVIKEADHICGVPYAALSIATLVAVNSDRSLLVRRKEAKSHGTKKMVEGVYSQGETCVIVEDVVSSGLSIVETVQDLKKEGLKAMDAIVLLDREQGGTDSLKSRGINVLSVITLTQVLQYLKGAGKLEQHAIDRVKEYIAKNRLYLPESLPVGQEVETKQESENRLQMRFETRAEKAENAISARLLRLMAEKRTTLCVAADVEQCASLLDIASQVGPYVCVLKTHIDILEDFSPDFVKSLQKLATQHNFMIMEDRKYADIGNTVRLQYTGGLYTCSSWADLVTTHSTPGKGIIDGLKMALESTEIKPADRACFIVVEMSSEGALTSAQYRAESIKMAENRSDFVAGVVSQSALGISSPGLVQLTPGVQLSSGAAPAGASPAPAGDGLGQQYNSPEEVVLQRGADVAVVGRGITRSQNVAEAARSYRDLLWAAYEKRIGA